MESQRFLSLRESKIFYASAAKNVRWPTRSMLETQRVQVEIQTIKLKLNSLDWHSNFQGAMKFHEMAIIVKMAIDGHWMAIECALRVCSFLSLNIGFDILAPTKIEAVLREARSWTSILEKCWALEFLMFGEVGSISTKQFCGSCPQPLTLFKTTRNQPLHHLKQFLAYGFGGEVSAGV